MLYDMCEQLKFGNETTTGGRHDERHCRRRRVGEGEGDDVSGAGGEGVETRGNIKLRCSHYLNGCL